MTIKINFREFPPTIALIMGYNMPITSLFSCPAGGGPSPIMQNHFLPDPPTPLRHRKSLFAEPPLPPSVHDVINEQPLMQTSLSDDLPV